MNAKKKRGKQTGKMHQCADAAPSCAADDSPGPAAQAAAADLDRRDREASPQRKSPGPRRKRRKKVASAKPSSTPDMTPAAVTKPDAQK